MKYTNLGTSGLKVSRIALGMGVRGERDETKIVTLVEHAVDIGVNFFDCANVYGPGDDRAFAGRSETLLGQAIAGIRDDVVITSKVGSAVGAGVNDRGGSRYHIMRELDRSLQRLKTDHIDVYIMHMPDPDTALLETVETFDFLVRQGKVLYWGLSNYSAWEACQALWLADANGLTRPILLQNPYSLFNRNLEQDLCPFAQAFDLGIMAYSPLAIGMLADRDAEKPNPETRMIWSGLLGINAADALPQDVQNVKSKLARMATTRNIPSAQIAISWVLQNDSVSVAVAGADSPSQLDDYISAVDVQMMPDELAELDQSSLGFTHLPLFAEIKPTNSPQRNS